jgi:hypothetical protein
VECGGSRRTLSTQWITRILKVLQRNIWNLKKTAMEEVKDKLSKSLYKWRLRKALPSTDKKTVEIAKEIISDLKTIKDSIK